MSEEQGERAGERLSSVVVAQDVQGPRFFILNTENSKSKPTGP